MDLSPPVPFNPPPSLLLSPLLCFLGECVWHEFRVFVMGALPAALFLLSVWHFRWTRPPLYLRSSSLITMCNVSLSPPSHKHVCFAFSHSSPLSRLKRTHGSSHLFMLYRLVSLPHCSLKEEICSVSPRGVTHFSWRFLFTYLLARRDSQLPLFFPLHLCVCLSHLPFLQTSPFLSTSPFLLSRLFRLL